MSLVIDAFEQVVPKDLKILVACSGGVDSMALLHACHVGKRQTDVLHVNYHLRDAASEADEICVQKACERYGFPLKIVHADPTTLKENGKNIQQEARKIRFDAMRAWLVENPEGIVLLGHHADDQIETFFLQLARGGGSYGLAGMHPIRERFVRPFLNLRKKEIYQYAQTELLSWREDLSNHSNLYLRNRLRNQVLPFLEEQNPHLPQQILFFQEKLREQQALMHQHILPALERWTVAQEIDLSVWENWNPAERLTFLKAIGAPDYLLKRGNHFSKLQEGAKIDFGFTTLRRVKNTLKPIVSQSYQTSWEYKITVIKSIPNTFDKHVLYIDPTKLVGDIKVRLVATNDYISPPGLEGKQRVHKVLKDAGVPASIRKKYFIFSDDQGVIWIPTIKTDKRCLADMDAPIIWKIEIQ